MKPGQWKPGQSGNPGGRPSERIFTDLLRLVGNEIDTVSGKRKMRRLAEKVYELALKGESWAANAIMDRVDGRPQVQAVVEIQSNQEVKALSDDELLALIAKQQAAIATQEKDDEAPKG
jgi:hypothetical protein